MLLICWSRKKKEEILELREMVQDTAQRAHRKTLKKSLIRIFAVLAGILLCVFLAVCFYTLGDEGLTRASILAGFLMRVDLSVILDDPGEEG